MSEMLLELDSLRRSFGKRVAVDNLSLSIRRGEIFGLLGPNGAGKSTAFHLLTGLLAADSGQVIFDGVALSPTDPRLRRRLGVVFQEPSLDDKLTGLENLQLGAALYGLRGRHAAKRIAEMSALVELTDRLHDPVEQYSGGMKRRLEIARVLLHRPDMLILDEPGRGIDQPTQRRIWEQLIELNRREKLTVLLTTHQPDEAEHCHRLAILDEGRLIACDSPDALKRCVGGDVIALESEHLDQIWPIVQRDFSTARRIENQIVVEVPRGHEVIPRLVEKLPAGVLRSVELRRPTLGDVFLHLTGRGLGATA